MKIRTTSLAAGPEGVVHPDTEMEVDDELGKLMVKGGAAVAVKPQKVDEEVSEDEEASDETASLDQKETAATRTGRKRGRKRKR